MSLGFGGFHPAVNVCFFLPVIGLAMFCTHPAYILAVLVCGIIYDTVLKGGRALLFDLLFVIVFMVIMSVINGLFSHNGKTVLFYIGYNRITLEAFIYGAVVAVMVGSVIIWFKNLSTIITGEKINYIFGRISPVFALLLSLILRYIPLLRGRYRVIRDSDKLMHINGRGKSSPADFARRISILTTWSLESSMDTADYMEARGWGLKGRTSFHLYRFRARDGIFIAIVLLLFIGVLFGTATGHARGVYFPGIKIEMGGVLFVLPLLAYIVLMLLPVIVDIVGEVRWKHYASKR